MGASLLSLFTKKLFKKGRAKSRTARRSLASTVQQMKQRALVLDRCNPRPFTPSTVATSLRNAWRGDGRASYPSSAANQSAVVGSKNEQQSKNRENNDPCSAFLPRDSHGAEIRGGVCETSTAGAISSSASSFASTRCAGGGMTTFCSPIERLPHLTSPADELASFKFDTKWF